MGFISPSHSFSPLSPLSPTTATPSAFTQPTTITTVPSSSSSTSFKGKVLPTFPIEVQKKILHYALCLPPVHPPPPLRRSRTNRSRGITADIEGSNNDHDYDDPAASNLLAGQTARQAGVRRVVERLGTHRSAMSLMRVCRAWKKEAAPYLYAEPHLTTTNLYAFAHALIQGHKKWSDINLHPHSTPGRYVTTLDLTQLREGYELIHPTTLSKILQSIFPLIPNLLHLKLPSGVILPLEDIRRAPFARRLRSIEGIQVNYDIPRDTQGYDPVIRLLKGLPNLELLSVFGPGDIDAPHWTEYDEYGVDDTLVLDKLHTLILSGVKTGLLLTTLIEAGLPELQRLLMTSYRHCEDDITYAFQSQYGHKVTSLTYLPAREWPGFRALPPVDTLELFPEMLHFSYLLPKDLGHLADILQLEDTSGAQHPPSSSSPLRSLTIPKWTMTATDRWDPDINGTPTAAAAPHVMSGPKRLMATLIDRPPQSLKRVTIDGFRWVRADLGVRALQTGDSGEMRSYAEKLRVGGIEMVDMDGVTAPAPPQGYGTSMGLGGNALGMISTDAGKGRRRSSGPRIEMVRVRSDELDEDGG